MYGPSMSSHDRQRDADVGDHQVAAVRVGRRQHEGDLRRGERHRHRRLDGLPLDLVAVGRQPGRQVDRDDRNTADRFTSATTVSSMPLNWPRKPVPRMASTISSHCGDLAEVQFPLLRVGDLDDRQADAAEHFQVRARIAAHVRDAPEQEHRRLDAALDQRPRDDEAVAAVVPAAAQHRDVAGQQVVERRFHRRDRLPPGVLHQDDRRDTDVLDRAAIGLAHLLCVEHPHEKSERTACARLPSNTTEFTDYTDPDFDHGVHGLHGSGFRPRSSRIARIRILTTEFTDYTDPDFDHGVARIPRMPG